MAKELTIQDKALWFRLVEMVEIIRKRVLASSISDVEEIKTTDDITSVPGTFADEAAVQSYLATAVPEIESRLDTIEAKIDEILTASNS